MFPPPPVFCWWHIQDTILYDSYENLFGRNVRIDKELGMFIYYYFNGGGDFRD